MLQKKSSWRCPLTLSRPKQVRRPTCQQQEYQPKTLHTDNQQRRVFLPTFPPPPPPPPAATHSNPSMNQGPLLLTNVSPCLLSSVELARRTTGTFPDPFQSDLKEQGGPSYMYDLYKHLFHDLTKRLHVDTRILDYNLHHLHDMIAIFISNYRSYHRSHLLFDHHFQLPTHEQHVRMLHQHELLILLEFFLQMDVDLFYMKTCTFRSVDLSLTLNHLFCTDDVADTWYNMEPCHRLCCPLCSSTHDPITSIKGSTVCFTTSGQKHRFVNGYEAILNGTATCQTTNMVYVLTCVCGDYDYIGSTQLTLNEVLEYHRQHIHRILFETLLHGQPYEDLCNCISNRVDKERANRMRLYQHVTHCSTALQLFLNYHPTYGCFIPIENHDAQFEDLSYTRLAPNVFIENDEIDRYLSNIPAPPKGYAFSKRQYDEQRQFFQIFADQSKPLCSTLDLYKATIVAVLPEQCSSMLRHMIEILFVTHAETKLNSMTLITSDTHSYYGVPYNKETIWCANLLRSSIGPDEK